VFKPPPPETVAGPTGQPPPSPVSLSWHHAGSTPLPHPSSPRGAAHDPSPTPPRRYKSLHNRLSPLFTPLLLPPRQGHAQRPTSPPLPPVHLGQPERRRLPRDYRCRHLPLVSLVLQDPTTAAYDHSSASSSLKHRHIGPLLHLTTASHLR
jgi:hypothetical protein